MNEFYAVSDFMQAFLLRCIKYLRKSGFPHSHQATAGRWGRLGDAVKPHAADEWRGPGPCAAQCAAMTDTLSAPLPATAAAPARATAPVRAGYRAFCPITTRWSDNDVYGHVNNVVYYSWFDTAVNAHLIAAGVLDIHGGDTMGLVVETQCNYFSPVAYPQKVEVGIRVARLGSSSVRYEVAVFAEGSDTAAAAGHFVHVYVDAATRRPTSLPRALRDVLQALVAHPL